MSNNYKINWSLFVDENIINERQIRREDIESIINANFDKIFNSNDPEYLILVEVNGIVIQGTIDKQNEILYVKEIISTILKF